MLINSECVAQAPSRQVALAPSRGTAAAGSRQTADLGLGAILRDCGHAGPAVEAGRKAGIWGGGDRAAAGYVPGQLAVSPAKASQLQASGAANSAVQNSSYEDNYIQMTRLVPAFRGEVGPHPMREPGPA
jgi:hypothetical protein